MRSAPPPRLIGGGEGNSGFDTATKPWFQFLSVALTLFLATPAAAEIGFEPSFDCAKAATPVEKTLCTDEGSLAAARDGILGEYYKALKGMGGHDAVLAGQSAWLKKRDQCGTNINCLERAYDRRLAELAKSAGDEQGVTGSYGYDYPDNGAEENTDSGDLFAYRDVDGTLTGWLDSVSGPTFHTCGVEFESAEAFGDAWLWTDSAENKDYDGRICRVLFRMVGGKLRVDSIGCGNYCGARGHFDETYVKAK